MAVNLPALADVERLSPRIIRILGGNPGKFTLQGTNTYLVGSGRARILIDTGAGRRSWAANLEDVLRLEDAHVQHALLTHHHADHTSGVSDLLRLCPDATIYKYPDSSETQHPIYQPIYDNQLFIVPGATLCALHTPGHTPDHVAFHLPDEDVLFTGDAVLGHGTTVFDDLELYMISLRRLQTLIPPTTRIYPGHGAVVDDGPARIEQYIRHRETREEEVKRALSMDGASVGVSVKDIVQAVYPELPPELVFAAEEGVKLILEKLNREGIVVPSEHRPQHQGPNGNGLWRLLSK